MYAVIVSGGKQHRVSEGQVFKVQKLNFEEGASIEFDQVLMIGAEDATQVGQPYVAGARVKADVIKHGRGDKIRIIKFRRRKHHMKRMGHRQDYTEIKITHIQAA
jgi:large subunit ribosomal protein L21